MGRTLEEFLALPDVENIEEEVFVSKRLGKFKVKAMTQDEFGEYQKRARGKISKDGIDFDTTKFQLMMVAGQTVEPNFKDAELLKKAGCATAIDFIKKKLLVGEIAELASQIQKVSGFDSDINEDIEEAKN
jgi:hypothetical protein